MGWHGDGIPIPSLSHFFRPSKPHSACHSGLRWYHIRKCCKWIRLGDCTKQTCIRQNHSKILDICVQFTSHTAANIHCSVRFLGFQSQHLQPIQSNTFECDTCITLKEKIHLHHTVCPKKRKCCEITNVAIAGSCKAKRQPLTPRPQWWNVALQTRIPAASNSLTITSEKHRVKRSCRNLTVWKSPRQGRNAALSIRFWAAGNNLTITSEKQGVEISCRNLDVGNSCLLGWNVALSMRIRAASNSLTITSEKHCVTSSCRNLGIWQSFSQGWKAALSIVIEAATNGFAITSEKHCVKPSCRNLDVGNSCLLGWNVALSTLIETASNSLTITSEKHCVKFSCWNLDVWKSSIQRWNGALSISVFAASNSLTITSEKRCVRPSCSNLGIWNSFIQGWNAALVTPIAAVSNSLAITSEKHCVPPSCLCHCPLTENGVFAPLSFELGTQGAVFDKFRTFITQAEEINDMLVLGSFYASCNLAPLSIQIAQLPEVQCLLGGSSQLVSGQDHPHL